jgi:hypothetical protein
MTVVDVVWRKSSFSGNAGNCVEVAFAATVAVRDAKNTTGKTLGFPVASWSAFVGRR